MVRNDRLYRNRVARDLRAARRQPDFPFYLRGYTRDVARRGPYPYCSLDTRLQLARLYALAQYRIGLIRGKERAQDRAICDRWLLEA